MEPREDAGGNSSSAFEDEPNKKRRRSNVCVGNLKTSKSTKKNVKILVPQLKPKPSVVPPPSDSPNDRNENTTEFVSDAKTRTFIDFETFKTIIARSRPHNLLSDSSHWRIRINKNTIDTKTHSTSSATSNSTSSATMATTIIYWMRTSHRIEDNLGLILAQRKSKEMQTQLIVVKIIGDDFKMKTARKFRFLVKGLQLVESGLRSKYNIPLQLWFGSARNSFLHITHHFNVVEIVADFSPLKEEIELVNTVLEVIPSSVIFTEVDNDHVVPLWTLPSHLSTKRSLEYHIDNVISSHLKDFPTVQHHYLNPPDFLKPLDLKNLSVPEEILGIDQDVDEGQDDRGNILFIPGEEEALKRLHDFIFKDHINPLSSKQSPEIDISSNLSPYIAHGFISTLRCVLEIKRYLKSETNPKRKNFIRNAVHLGLTAGNYVLWNKNYSNFDGTDPIVKKSLISHEQDTRIDCDTADIQLGTTYDQTWNVIQKELVQKGFLSFALRRYWANSLIRLTVSPSAAFKTALELLLKYSLDSVNPALYYGIAQGQHGRDFPNKKKKDEDRDKPIYGLVREINTVEDCNRFGLHMPTYLKSRRDK